MPATTFDSNFKGAGVTLSNGNKTATFTGAGTQAIAATRVSAVLLAYWEMVASAVNANISLGLVNRTLWWSMSTYAQLIGFDLNGCGVRSTDGGLYVNNASLATVISGGYTTGDRIQFALRSADRLLFVKKNNTGNWNNDGTADPTTTTGGIDISSMNPGAMLPAASALTATPDSVAIAALSSADWSYSAPSGYDSVDNCTITAISLDCLRYGKNWPTTVRKTVSGTVEQGGTPISGHIVSAYDQVTDELLGETVSAGDGTFSIPVYSTNRVRVVAKNPTLYNVIVFDNVIPA